ncbi:MAG: dual specificity protein phosphatase family protein [Nitrospira sp.]|nr:MAG: dual specificity protein phosphatase family protein [Nitrospira sp.]
MVYITPALIVGSKDDAKNPPLDLGGLLIVAEEVMANVPSGVPYLRVPLKEFKEADVGGLYQSVQWMEQHTGENPLLVCCRAGMGRSVSVLIAYLCCIDGMSYTDALALVKERRQGAFPLPGLERTIEKVKEWRRDAQTLVRALSPPTPAPNSRKLAS